MGQSSDLEYTQVMNVHISETTVDPQGRVVLDRLPFQPGEKVDVLRYDEPFEPVAPDDWELQP